MYPLDPALTNIFMCSSEYKWLKDCPHGLNPVFNRPYFNDIFVLSSSLDHAEELCIYFRKVVIVQTS